MRCGTSLFLMAVVSSMDWNLPPRSRPRPAGCPLFLSLSLCPMGHFPTFPPTWSSSPPPPKRQACERGRFRHVCISTRKGLRLGSSLSGRRQWACEIELLSRNRDDPLHSQPIQTNENLRKSDSGLPKWTLRTTNMTNEDCSLVRVRETLHSPVQPSVCA